jgi:segregation and condensation protein A
MFLAILELARHHYVSFDQGDLFGEIWILPGKNFDRPLDLSSADNYDYEHSEVG